MTEKILIDRSVLEQALGWFDWLYTGVPEEMDGQKSHDIRLALRTALAEQPAEQEPADGCVVVARPVLRKLGIDDAVIDTIARPQPAKREPLTDEDLRRIYETPELSGSYFPALRKIACAIIAAYEKKNGIGGQV